MPNFRKFPLRTAVLLGCLLSFFAVEAQVPVPFTVRYQETLKGDMTMIANNIVNRQTSAGWFTPATTPNDPYSGNTANDNSTMRYIDIDGDGSTFSSSSATLTIDDIGCSTIVYAGLYWSATYRYNGSNSGSGRATDFNEIKLKLPGGASYLDITGEVIFDGFTDSDFSANSPYACYADVTSHLAGLADPNGVYTVANIRATQASLTGGVSGGWTLFVVYENPQLPGRYITSFDGFAGVNEDLGNVDVNYSGFITVPSPLPVRAKLAAAALEGDKQIDEDQLLFKANLSASFSELGNSLNPTGNFFRSTISTLDDDNNPVSFTARVPNSANTLGYDSDIINIQQGLLPNGSTAATLRITSDQDTYYMFFNALNVDIIEPEMQLVKSVRDIAGNDIAGQDVTLGQVLDYNVSFKNVGNDDATNTVIRDILPVNTNFTSVNVTGAPGVTYTYDAVTREILFTIPDNLVEEGDPAYNIKIRVQVVNTCSELTDACSNIIQNTAYSTYEGVLNSNQISDDPSVAGVDSCGLGLLGPANFLVDIDECAFTRTEILCGASVLLTAGDGYASYAWYRENGVTDIPLGTTQSITVNSVGEYYVINTPTPPCIGMTEYITVVLFGDTQSNPVAPFADEIAICPNDGEELPNIFLCGINDTRLIESNITDAQSIVWEKLDEGSCPAVGIDNCANKNLACTWNQVGTGANYEAALAGQYRVTINYQNGCFNRYYFNVYANLLDPQYTYQDMICGSPGHITVTNVPAGYEFELVDQVTDTVLVPYQTDNVFPIAQAGAYTVNLRQQGVTDGCIFTLPNIGILDIELDVDIIIEDATCNGLGSITLQALNVVPQYYFEISGPSTDSHGPLMDNNHTFENLNPGTYDITVTTDDGCSFTDTAIVEDRSHLTAAAFVTQNVSCTSGFIGFTPAGGQEPYEYAVYSYNGVMQNPDITDFTDANPFEILPGEEGTYVFIMQDYNGCTVLSNEVTIENMPEVQYTTDFENVSCNGANDGTITFDVTATNGFGVSFELLAADDGEPLGANNSGVFTGLAPGDYIVNLLQEGTETCSFPTNFTITEPAAITATASVTQPYDCDTMGATITVNTGTVSGGTAPYEYSIDGITFGAATSFGSLTAGTYTVTVRDDSGCTFQTTAITIDPLTPPTDITFAATPVTCPDLSSDVTLTVIGGVGPFSYEITAPASAIFDNGNNAVFSDLDPGTYTFLVTDDNGCTFQKNHTINAITQIDVNGQPASNVTCFGQANGSLTFNVTGFSTNYDYEIENSMGVTVASATNLTLATIPLNSLVAETYTITVTDNTTNCTATASVDIEGPASALVLAAPVVTAITCTTDGSISVSASGGWGSYQYELEQPDGTIVGPQATTIFANLSQIGTYTLSVTDANGCIDAESFSLSAPVPPVASIAASSDICYDANAASLTVDVTGGLAPFQYSINGAPNQASATFSGLTPNTYTIIVTDANNCTDTIMYSIDPQLTASAILTKGLDCSASPDAEISVTINGGLASYTYQVSVNGGAYGASAPVVGTTINYTATTAGTYQFRITDASGCTAQTAVISVQALTLPAITSVTQSQNILCNNDESGAITVVIDNTVGTPPYTVNVENTTTGTDYDTQTSGLPAGDYSITVTDSNGCVSDVETITLSEPAALDYDVTSVDITCNNPGGTSFGQIIVENVTGGTAGYTYHVSSNFGFSETHNDATGADYSFTILTFGIYQVEVVDANGCSVVTSNIIIASPPDDLDIDIAAVTADCVSGGTAEVTVTTAVLSNDYEFAILETTTPPYSTNYLPADVGTPETRTFTGLIPGVTYTFVVHDNATDCYYFKTADVPVDSPSLLTATLDDVNNVTCTGSADGNVTFTFDGYDAAATDVEYEIFLAQSNLTTGISGSSPVSGGPVTVNNFAALAPGMYYILFTEIGGTMAGCTNASAPFTILQSTNMLDANVTLIKNDNCNANAGQISASAQFGTAPYQYQLVNDGDPAPTAATWAGSSVNIFNVEGGDYTVYVKDAYDCIKEADITVPTDPSPEITASVTNQCDTANGSFSIEVDRTVNGVAPYSYSFNGGAFQAEADAVFTYDNLTSGAYTIIIRDANGCTDTANVTILAPLNLTPVATTQPSCADNDGVITVTGFGGSGNYEYELQTDTGATVVAQQASPVFTGLSSGDYSVIIYDTSSSCTEEALVSLDAATPVTFIATGTDVSCNNGTDGTIVVTLDVSNDNPPYTYEINDGVNPPVSQASPVFTGLEAGSYTITVTSGKDCIDTNTIDIEEPTQLAISATATEFACDADNTVNTSEITITVEDDGMGNPTGTGPYSYSINGTNYFTANTFNVVDTGSTQNLIAYVKDSNNCITSVPVVIEPLAELTAAIAAQVTAMTCTNDETVEITVTGGSGDFTFELLPDGSQPAVTPGAGVFTANFDLDQTGSYTFRVTDNETGCHILTTAYEVLPFDTLEVNATNAGAVTCFGDTDGSITINVTGYTGAYDYDVQNSGGSVATGNGNTTVNPLTITGLPAGNYYVTVTAIDTPFCSEDSATITVPSPANALTLDINDDAPVTCDNNQGEIIAMASGGWGDYEYELVNNTTTTTVQAYATNNIFTGLSAGSYTVSVQDAGGCIVSQAVTLVLPSDIVADIDATLTHLLCFGDNSASVSATGVSGGEGIYQYILNYYDETGTAIESSTGGQTTPQFDNLGAGTYSITVTDGWNCDVITDTVTITQPDPVQGNLSLTDGLSCTTQAELTITGSGGTPPYQYSTDGVTYNATNTFTVDAGVYQYYITDANGCEAVHTNEVTVLEVPELILDLNLDSAEINCADEETASITADALGGLGNYQYELLDASSSVLEGPQASGTFSDLAAGDYYVRVVSDDCEEVSSLIQIANPDPLDITATKTDILCFGDTNGTIEFETTGGTGIIQYAISPNLDQFDTDNIFTGLSAGIYDLIVQDQNGCFDTFQFEILEPEPLAADFNTVVDEQCLGDANGSITIDITGGTGDYEVSLDNITFDPVTGAQHTFNGLAGGVLHYIYVRDSNGCNVNPPLEQYLNSGVDIQPVADVEPNCTANVPGNVVTIEVNPAVAADVEYSLDGVTYDVSNTFTDLAAGDYTAYVQHTNGCTQTVDFTIDDLEPLDATVAVTDVLCFGNATGEIEVTATGGTGVLEYAISPAFAYGTNNVFTGLTAGSYTVRVRDEIGCEFEITGVTIAEPAAALSANAVPIGETCITANDGSITITPAGGTAPYSTSLDNVTYTEGLFVYDNLADGDYTVYVTDANGCAITPLDVTITQGVDIQPVAEVIPTCTSNVVGNVVFINVNPGVLADVQYSLDNITYSTTNAFNDLAPGDYTAYVQHTNGCTQTVDFTIDDLEPVDATTSVTDVLCFGNATGEIEVTATGGTGALEYAISPSFIFGSSNIFTGLIAGSYTIRVRDEIGCEFEVTGIMIAEPAAALSANAVPVGETCITANDGSITITPAGGTAPYSTSLDNATYTEGLFIYDNLADGDYTVYVTDANGCAITPIDVTITQGVDIQPVADIVPNCTANVPGNVVTIEVNPAVVADVQYSLDGVTYDVTNVFNDLAAGDYTAYVQHTNGCVNTVDFTIDDLEPVDATAAVTDVLCFGNATGEIEVTATGGTGALEYAISPAFVFGADNVFTGLVAGSYTVRVRDEIGCEFEVTGIMIAEPAAALSANAVPVGETCITANDGSITITPAGGTAPYSTSLDNVTYTEGLFVYDNLADGDYTVYVTDANGCAITPIDVTITQGVDIQPVAEVIPTCTSNVVGNVVFINVNPGVLADVQYSLDNIAYSALNTFNDLAPGDYTAYVQHTNGCTQTVDFTIDDLEPVDATAAVVDVLCFGNATGEIEVAATGGTGVLEYAISPSFTFGSSNTFTGLTAGSYTVRVRDEIGCEFEVTSIMIAEPAAALSANAVPVGETCITANDGTITITPAGGTAPYSTSLDNVTYTEGLFVYDNLADGDYTVYVTDANGCAITPINVTITQGVDIQPVADIVPNCTANVPGNVVTIEVNPAVAADVEYSLDGVTYDVSNTFTDLAAGDYTAYVQHTNGCTQTVDFTIDDLEPVNATAAVTDVLCFGNATGEIEVTATGGTGVLEYAISPAFAYGTNNVFTGLTAGSYTVRVRDEIGCEFEVTGIMIAEPAAALSANAVPVGETCITANDGSITITPAGGTAPYSTSLDNVTYTEGLFVYDNLADGDYTVYVTDANGCAITPIDVTITQGVDIQPVAEVIPTCTSNVVGNVVFINVNPGVLADVQYSLDNITYSALNTFNDLAPGDYTAYVQHTNGCTQTVDFTIDDLEPLDATAAVTDVLCFGNATGEIEVTATGGTGVLEYAISPAFSYGTDNVFTGLTAGSYTVRVRDEISCEFEITGVMIAEPAAALSANAVPVGETCITANDGSITITPAGGTAPYSTSLDNVTYTEGLFVYDNLADGDYTVYVTDANGCAITPINVTITQGVDIQPVAEVIPMCTSNVVGNVVFINVNPGVLADVQYSLDNITYSALNTFSDLAPGDYTAYVQHTNGCTQTVDFTIDDLEPVAATVDVVDVLCFGNATGEIEVTATGGTGALEYAISPSFTFGSSNTFTGLIAGSYTIRVRDEIGCEFEVTGIMIAEPAAALSANAVPVGETCITANDGSITVTPAGGTAPYSTSLDNATYTEGLFIYDNLADGDYTVYVTDANGCAITPIDVTITQGVDIQPVADFVPNCTANVPGNVVTIEVNPAVAADVEYSLDGVTYDVSNTFTDLAAGDYTAYVQHTNGCTQTVDFTIDDLEPVDATASVVDVLCFGNATGEIEVTATGGTGVLEYAISPSFTFGSSNTFTGLNAGSYTVRVRDEIGCEFEVTGIMIAEPAAALSANAVPVGETCITANDGSITITPAGGTAPYSTSLDNVTYTEGLFVYDNLADGDYTVYVADANGCAITPIDVTITQGVDIQPVAEVIPMCTSNVVGNVVFINVNPSVLADVQYSLDNITYSTTNAFNDLAPGDYTAYVQHTNGCTQTVDFTIDDLEPVDATASVTDVLCFGNATGEIEVTATGGTGALEYAISPAFVFGTDNVFTGLTAGSYTVRVRDAIGCEFELTGVTIAGPAAALSANAEPVGETCITANDGSITITPAGGTAPYSTSLDNVTYTEGLFVYDNLTDGDYTVYVTDANGCAITPIDVTITQGVDIQPVADIIPNCTANVPGNVVTIEVNPAVASDVQYSLDGVTYDVNNVFTDLAAGDYTAYVQHTNGCTQTVDFTIDNLEPVDATAAVVDVLCFGNATGEIEVTATGGTGALEYAISPSFTFGSSNTFTGLTAGSYTVRVRDEIGCEFEITSVTIAEPAAALSANAVPIGETCITANDGSITITPAGGTAPYSTSLDNVTYTEGLFVYDNLADGDYTVYVTDANGCAITPIDVTIIQGVDIQPVAEVIPTCTGNVVGNVVFINVNPSVLADVQYSLDNITYSALNTFNDLAPGDYTAYVQHTNGCTQTVDFTIDDLEPVDASTSVVDVLCFGNATGEIEVTATGGTGALEYAVSPSFTFGSSNIFTGLTAGSYTVRVRDEIGCEFEVTGVTIAEPAAALSANAVPIGETCITANDGSITITPAGGTAPYSTSLDNVTYTEGLFVYDNLADGDYTVYVTDTNGCAITPIDVTITQGVDIQPVAEVIPTCTGNVVGNVVFINVNPSVLADVQYSLDNITYSALNTFSDLAPSDYTAYVQHTNGCTQTVDFTIDDLEPVDATTTVVDVLCFGNVTGEIEVTATGGTGALEYAISPSFTFGSSNIFTGLTAGSYTVRVRDEIGCEFEVTGVTIAEPAAALSANAVPVGETCITANDGSITITPAGGTAPYSTSLDNVTYTEGLFVYDNLADGDYTVYVTDANGCQIVLTNTIITQGVDIQPVVEVIPTCDDNAAANVVFINVNPDVIADVQYSLDGVTYTANNVYTDLTPGDYTAYVQHTNGCMQTVDFTIDNHEPVDATASVVDVLCFGNTTGEIEVAATGGTGVLEYAISPDFEYGSSTTFNNLPAGSYTVRVRDEIGCEFEIANVLISEPAAALSANAVPTGETCITANDGTITITPAGGTAPYSTSLDNVTYTEGLFVYDNLADGDYTVYVTDANGCAITPIDVSVSQGVDIQATAAVVPTCDNNIPGNAVTIEVNPAVAANVEYSLDGVTYDVSNVFTDLVPGDYTAYVQHTNGCTQTVDFIIDDLEPVAATAAVIDVLCFGNATGEIEVTATGGTGTIEYAISPAFTYGSSNIFENLTAGSYTIRVRDEIGCEFEITGIVISQPATALSATTEITGETCINESNGSITITPAGGTAPYSTSIDGVTYTEGLFIYEDLADDDYTVYVSDANGCAITPIDITITQGVDIQAVADVVPTCDNNVPGNVVSIEVNPAVAADVQYSLDGITYTSINVYSDLTAGDYTAYVQHSNGCVDTVDFTIDNHEPVAATVDVDDVLCFGQATGEIEVNATGGTGTLEYAISPAFEYGTNDTFNDLAAGTYTIRVRDEIGCEFEIAGIVITQPAMALSATVAVTGETCITSNDGTITITPAGGTAPYSTSLNGILFNEDEFVYDDLANGNYTVYVKDANGCTITLMNVTITQGVNIQAEADVVPTCEDNVPGNVVTIEVNPAVAADVEYSLDGVTYTASNVLTDLAPDDYTAFVQHANGCVDTVEFTVEDHDPIGGKASVTDVLCFGDATGVIEVETYGGTGTLEYGIGPDFEMTENPVFENLPAGTYTLIVQDEIGCTLTITAVINQPLQVVAQVENIFEEICIDDDNGAFEISVSGGISPYYTSLEPDGNFVGDQFIFDGLNGGAEYTVYVQDSRGCNTSITVELEAPINLDAELNIDYDCEFNTVTVELNPLVKDNVTFSLNGTEHENTVFENLPDGDYVIDVVHTSGCSYTANFTIENSTPMSVTLAETGFNELTATVTGGYGDYEFYFNDDYNGSSNVYVFDHSGTYTVTVTDSRGCEVQASITVVYIPITIPDVVTPNDDGQNDSWSPKNTDKYPGITTDIFDRYGRKLATLRQGQTWNGKYNGTEMPSGDYWYLIKLGDEQNREFVGHFTIFR